MKWLLCLVIFSGMALALPPVDVEEPEIVAEDTIVTLAPEINSKGIGVENVIEVEPSPYNREPLFEPNGKMNVQNTY